MPLLERPIYGVHVPQRETIPCFGRILPMQRYFIRRGTIGWTVWDRERKGPAVVLERELVRLTEEQAIRSLGHLTKILGQSSTPATDE